MQHIKSIITVATAAASLFCLVAHATPMSPGSSSDAATPAASGASSTTFGSVISGVKNFLAPFGSGSIHAAPAAGTTTGTTATATATGAARLPTGLVSVPDAAPGTSTTDWPASGGCRIVPTYTSTLDVDTVYAHAMSAYTFHGLDREQLQNQLDPTHMTEGNILHERVTGSYYHLRQTIDFKRDPKLPVGLELDVEIAKHGTGSDVGVKYCYITRDPVAGTVDFHAKLQQRFRAELG